MKKTNDSMTVHRSCGCGTIHMSVEYDDEYAPLRVQIILGKSGGCAACQLQALQGSLNERLKNDQDISYVFDKKNDNSWLGIRCPQIQHEEETQPLDTEDEKINLSCPDVIAKILKYALGKLDGWKEEKKEPKK